jgi:hypothetical protein
MVCPWRRAPGEAAPGSLDRVYVGGNSSLKGLDATGTDVWWTSSGNSISALACVDIDGDGRVEVGGRTATCGRTGGVTWCLR